MSIYAIINSFIRVNSLNFILNAMDQTHSSSPVSYQLYYLFNTKRPYNKTIVKEPSESSLEESPLVNHLLSKDSDKRLFHIEPADYSPLNLEKSLSDNWDKLQKLYGKEPCEALFLGVAVVLIGYSLPEITLNYLETEGHFSESVEFFKIYTDSEQKEIRAQFFGLNSKEKLDSDWQLTFTEGKPRLIPIREDYDHHPIFVVYGLECAETETCSQKFLRGLRKDSILTLLVPMLMSRHWQFSYVHQCSYHEFGEKLRLLNNTYREQGRKDEVLKCRKTSKLETEIQKMRGVQAEANYQLGRIPQAIESLQTNRGNLRRRMQMAEKKVVENKLGLIVWSEHTASENSTDSNVDHSERSELLETFQHDIRSLQKSETYLQGMLTYLEGHRLRWQAFLDEQRTEEWSEHLGMIGHVIIFLIALTETLNLTTHNHAAPTPAWYLQVLWYITLILSFFFIAWSGWKLITIIYKKVQKIRYCWQYRKQEKNHE